MAGDVEAEKQPRNRPNRLSSDGVSSDEGEENDSAPRDCEVNRPEEEDQASSRTAPATCTNNGGAVADDPCLDHRLDTFINRTGTRMSARLSEGRVCDKVDEGHCDAGDPPCEDQSADRFNQGCPTPSTVSLESAKDSDRAVDAEQEERSNETQPAADVSDDDNSPKWATLPGQSKVTALGIGHLGLKRLLKEQVSFPELEVPSSVSPRFPVVTRGDASDVVSVSPRLATEVPVRQLEATAFVSPEVTATTRGDSLKQRSTSPRITAEVFPEFGMPSSVSPALPAITRRDTQRAEGDAEPDNVVEAFPGLAMPSSVSPSMPAITRVDVSQPLTRSETIHPARANPGSVAEEHADVIPIAPPIGPPVKSALSSPSPRIFETPRMSESIGPTSARRFHKSFHERSSAEKLQGWVNVAWLDGSTYEGQFVRGKRHGHGAHVEASGRRYVGHWRSGLRNGYGTMFFNADRSAYYSGIWEDGLQAGEGTQVWESGNTYVGQFSQGKMHGQGMMTWFNDESVEEWSGTWENGMPKVGSQFSRYECRQKSEDPKHPDLYSTSEGSFAAPQANGEGGEHVHALCRSPPASVANAATGDPQDSVPNGQSSLIASYPALSSPRAVASTPPRFPSGASNDDGPPVGEDGVVQTDAAAGQRWRRGPEQCQGDGPTVPCHVDLQPRVGSVRPGVASASRPDSRTVSRSGSKTGSRNGSRTGSRNGSRAAVPKLGLLSNVGQSAAGYGYEDALPTGSNREQAFKPTFSTRSFGSVPSKKPIEMSAPDE